MLLESEKVLVQERTSNYEKGFKLVPMSLSVLYKSGEQVEYLFMKGQYFKASDCPYQLKAIGSRIYASMPEDEYYELYPEEEKKDESV